MTGLASEASCFPAPITRLHGVGLAAARINSQTLVNQNHDLLISAGLAGGLAPDLPCGCLVIGQSVLSAENVPIPCDPEIVNILKIRMATILDDTIPIRQGMIVSTPNIIADPEEKSRLHGETAAVAVDMESQAVGEIARKTGTPLAILRVIVDTANQTIPASAQAALNTTPSVKTSIRIMPLLGRLIRNPGEITELIQLAVQTRQALKTLHRCGSMLADKAATDRTTP